MTRSRREGALLTLQSGSRLWYKLFRMFFINNSLYQPVMRCWIELLKQKQTTTKHNTINSKHSCKHVFLWRNNYFNVDNENQESTSHIQTLSTTPHTCVLTFHPQCKTPLLDFEGDSSALWVNYMSLRILYILCYIILLQ